VRETTVYLPDNVKENQSRLAAETGHSESELIRQALVMLMASAPRPRPNGRPFDSGTGGLVEAVDEALPGFGER
jgi:hypothetical protein